MRLPQHIRDILMQKWVTFFRGHDRLLYIDLTGSNHVTQTIADEFQAQSRQRRSS